MTDRIRLSPDFKKNLDALLRTPPPPAGDPSTRKQKAKKAKKKR